jgi:hypothetical protein
MDRIAAGVQAKIIARDIALNAKIINGAGIKPE